MILLQNGYQCHQTHSTSRIWYLAEGLGFSNLFSDFLNTVPVKNASTLEITFFS